MAGRLVDYCEARCMRCEKMYYTSKTNEEINHHLCPDCREDLGEKRHEENPFARQYLFLIK